VSEQSTEEQLARALLTLVEVESCVAKIERYLESNGKYLDLSARVPMEHQTEAMRAALDAWKVPAPVGPQTREGEDRG
jgi:hypothetical protein